jgi:hypothetical protein
MSQALIDPNTIVNFISSWNEYKSNTGKTIYTPVYSTYDNSARVCQTESEGNTFPVSSPLFWTTCDDNVIADRFWYSTSNNTFNLIVNEPVSSNNSQPTSNGTITV